MLVTRVVLPHSGQEKKERCINGKKMGRCFGPCQNPVIPRGLNFTEYDIREIDEDLYLAVLDRVKAVREGV